MSSIRAQDADHFEVSIFLRWINSCFSHRARTLKLSSDMERCCDLRCPNISTVNPDQLQNREHLQESLCIQSCRKESSLSSSAGPWPKTEAWLKKKDRKQRRPGWRIIEGAGEIQIGPQPSFMFAIWDWWVKNREVAKKKSALGGRVSSTLGPFHASFFISLCTP